MMALIRVRALEIAFSPVMWTQRNLMMIILLLVPTVLFASMLSASCYAQAPLQHVVLTYSSRSIASIDLFIAQERGVFRDEGLDAQLVQVRATAAIAAIISGEVNALGSIGSAIRAIPRGAPIKVLTVGLRRPVFTDGIPTHKEISEYLKEDARILGLTAPLPATRVFNFSIQREVNQELGAR